MEKPMNTDKEMQAVADRAASKKRIEETLPKLKEVLGKHTKYPETLEGMFGKEKAARMRREAEIVDSATPEESKH